jgi:hypothetical protein
MDQSDEIDEALRKIRELPRDWWQSMHSASVLLKSFKTHVIPLLVVGSVNNKIQYNVYSGIFLEHGSTMLWLTAGHVVDELQQLLTSPAFKLSLMTWMDGYKTKEAEGVRLHRTDIPMKSWRAEGLDIGVVIPSLLDVGNILQNDKVIPVNSEIWKNLRQAIPEGYYAIGFPRPWSTHSQKPISNQKIFNSVNADLACLPLSEIAPPPEFSNDPVWSNVEAFYGKILPYTDNPNFEVDDVKGMSGGPVLSVERDPDGRILYRLVGIIQSWAAAQLIIRAEPIQKVAQAIDAWLREQQANNA